MLGRILLEFRREIDLRILEHLYVARSFDCVGQGGGVVCAESACGKSGVESEIAYGSGETCRLRLRQRKYVDGGAVGVYLDFAGLWLRNGVESHVDLIVLYHCQIIGARHDGQFA